MGDGDAQLGAAALFHGVLQDERKALASAEATLTECKAIVAQLKNTCALPAAKDVAEWAKFEFTFDFAAALGTLKATGKTLLHMQVQFVHCFMKFLRSASVLGHALSQTSKRIERKISPEWCEQVIAVRTDVHVLEQFVNMPKVKAEGHLFKDPQQPTVGQMVASPARSSLGARLNTGPVTETIKSAIALVTQLSCEWEADTDNFMKLVDGWMATGWEQNMNDPCSHVTTISSWCS